MCDLGFGFLQKTSFGSNFVPFNLRTSSGPQFYGQLGQWSTLAGEVQRFKGLIPKKEAHAKAPFPPGTPQHP